MILFLVVKRFQPTNSMLNRRMCITQDAEKLPLIRRNLRLNIVHRWLT